MGGDDSQKLLPWRGAYSSPGRCKPPALRNINTLAQRPSGDAMSRAATLSLGRMRTRNMIVAGRVPVIGRATKPL